MSLFPFGTIPIGYTILLFFFLLPFCVMGLCFSLRVKGKKRLVPLLICSITAGVGTFSWVLMVYAFGGFTLLLFGLSNLSALAGFVISLVFRSVDRKNAKAQTENPSPAQPSKQEAVEDSSATNRRVDSDRAWAHEKPQAENLSPVEAIIPEAAEGSFEANRRVDSVHASAYEKPQTENPSPAQPSKQETAKDSFEANQPLNREEEFAGLTPEQSKKLSTYWNMWSMGVITSKEFKEAKAKILR